MHMHPPTEILSTEPQAIKAGISGRGAELLVCMAAFIADVEACVSSAPADANPTAENWAALDVQLYAIHDLRRGLAALTNALKHHTAEAHQLKGNTQ